MSCVKLSTDKLKKFIIRRKWQYAGTILLICGCLQAVTITPLPYRGNEAGFRLPRGTATFLGQEEAERIRKEMLAERGSPGFYGGNDYDRHGYDKRSYDGRRNYVDRNRYFGNEIDQDTYYEKGVRDYYPNYNPEGSSSNRRDRECDPRGRPYDNRGQSSFHGEGSYNGANSGNGGYNGANGGNGGYNGGNGGYNGANRGNGGYNGRGGYGDKGRGGYNGGGGRGYEDRNRGYQPGYDRNRGGVAGGDENQWGGRGYNGSGDKDDNIGEGTVGFYGRSRRP